MSKDFNFKIRMCRTRKPETKGCVEARNKIIDWVRAYAGEFETLEELEAIIETINKDMNIQISQETNMSPIALFYKEKEYLGPLPGKDIIDAYLTPNKYKVSSDALIRYGTGRYSVDPKLIGEEVTVDALDNKLYIYYNGKLATIHELNEKPINYHENHYRKLMTGKIDENDMTSVVARNLETMDRLLSNREVGVSEKNASQSEESLIAYINQSEYGRWVINNYSHLSETERLVFIKGINEVLPYVADRNRFISYIKYSMKDNMCRNIAFDCWVEDFMNADGCYILTDEGYSHFKEKYSDRIKKLIDEITEQEKQHKKENQTDTGGCPVDKENARDGYDFPYSGDLPFDLKEKQ